MTQLASITNNHLALTCDLCGHTGMIAVTDLIRLFGRDMDARDAAKRARCSRCHVKGQTTFQIIYVGASGEAMLGAATKPDV